MDNEKLPFLTQAEFPLAGRDVILGLDVIQLNAGILYGREGCDDCDGGGCDGYIPDFPSPSGTLTLSPELIPTQQLQSLPNLQSSPHNSGYEVIYSPRASGQVAVISSRGRAVLDFFNSPHSLQQWPAGAGVSAEDAARASGLLYAGGFLVDSGEALQPPAPARKPSALEAWLYVTRACNLNCAHCYVQKDPRRMDAATGAKSIRQLFSMAQRDGFKTVKIKYAGGEPTLRWAFVQKLHNLALALAEETGLGLREILVTNGVSLSTARLEYLKENHITLSISLDGFGAGQDAQRPMSNGSGSFTRVMANIDRALAIGIRPVLTMTLTSLNLGDLTAVMGYALQNDLSLNLNFYRPTTSGDPLTARPADLVHALKQAIQVIRADLPPYRIIDRLIDRSNFQVSHQHTCGAGRNYLSIDTDGTVQPCHMLHGANDSTLSVPLQDLQSGFAGFKNPSIDERTSCQGCQWKYWCTGGCPIVAGNLCGSASASSPYCAVYKAIYPELIKLEAERLLKYGTTAQ